MQICKTEDNNTAVVMTHVELKMLATKYLQAMGKLPIGEFELHIQLGEEEKLTSYPLTAPKQTTNMEEYSENNYEKNTSMVQENLGIK